ncbi:hypothetical protein [Sphingomonas sp. Mn802worker]|uniref:hypothetical protein n=1 Tax=Sphingomonas sp. Mn802worker TaxID=629773 RepID=UPI0003798477|nr:hypothetical protein [Sphingomonas sp. Mn802worker]
MAYVKIDLDLLDQGKEAFSDFVRAAIYGVEAQAGDAEDKPRPGLPSLPGAAIACFDSGLLNKEASARAIAQATQCSRPTVDAFLAEFLGQSDDTETYDEASGYLLEQNLFSTSATISAENGTLLIQQS